MRSPVPNLNLSGLSGGFPSRDESFNKHSNVYSSYQAPAKQQPAAATGGGDSTARVNGRNSFLLDFFEGFHEAHEVLTNISTAFTRTDFFKESYMIEALHLGLPEHFPNGENTAM